jgi:alpha-beta hydrolase superfamily lysophospholipase
MHESSFAGVGGTNIFTRSRPAGSEYFYDHAGSTDKTLKLYEGHFHDC